ncbi:macrophage-expressed gene 1 protein-like [Mercenaria mercenaria]|uniref:macrophage-expressed gene 1 protein-like n=1 Tax=Mercenaria mercenaria TaxID=6596 RepID=UPI00234EB526|nr:macrophage-expressed gene 1 protein-like [Mercenaria mercenaria]
MIKEKFEVFEVLPGIGWDNIQNIELSHVLDKKYYQCKLTEDGKYLIPDNVLLIPIKQSHVDVFAEWINSMDEYRSIDAFSINGGLNVNVGFGDVGIGGSFSGGYQKAKMHMSKNSMNKYISRVQARYNRYRIVSDPNADLHPSFKDRLLEIASSYYNNHDHLAEYQCQLLIRDFGTHVQTSMDAGAVLFKEDHIDANSSIVDDAKKKGWQIGAGLSFSGIFDGVTVGVGLKFGMSKQKIEETIKEYSSKISYSVIKSYGGNYFGGNTSAAEWTDTLDNELVCIDRNGVPLYETVSSSTLPELPLSTIMKVEQGVKNAFLSYYKHNTYRGCMDPRNKNYDVKANVVDDGVCGGIKNENEYFGGVFQTCTMSHTEAGDTCKDKGYIQKNPLTSNFSCPEGYSAIELISSSISASQSHSKCKGHRHKKCKYWTTYSQGMYKSFWCARNFKKVPEQKYVFGGIFSNFKVNDLTGGRSCPIDFIPLRLGEGIFVCTSSNGNTIGAKFGGFFSCSIGNPLAISFNSTSTGNIRSWPKRCPQGYVQQTFAIVSNCELEYCSDAVAQGVSQTLPILKRPPFIRRPKVLPDNHTDLVLVVGGKWYKNEEAFKKMTEMETLGERVKEYQIAQAKMDRALADMADLYLDNGIQSDDDTPNQNILSVSLSAPAIAVISSLATLFCVIIASVVFFKCRQFRRGRNTPSRFTDAQNEMEHVQVDDGNGYGTAGERQV